MNYERQRQEDAHRARRARMGAPITPTVPVVAKPAPAKAPPPKLVVYVRMDPAPMTRCSAILNEVCDEYGITLWLLKSKSRAQPLVRARWQAAYRMYDECLHMSLPMVGRLLGHRHHTTILHGIQQWAAMNDLPMPRSRFEVAA
jgi:hypothetical protein